MNRVVQNPLYIFLTIVVIMPINGALMQRGNVVLGLCLIFAQLPLALSLRHKDAA